MRWNRPARGDIILVVASIAVLARGLRLAHVARLGAHKESTESERVARSLARGGRMAHVFSDQAGDTAHLAPLYPFILGMAHRLVGCEGAISARAQVTIATPTTVTGIALLPVVAVRTRLSSSARSLAGFFEDQREG